MAVAEVKGGRSFELTPGAGSDASDLLSDMDFHDRACALKQYLQSLPDCLLTSKFYSRFKTMAKMSDTELQIDYLKCLFVSLPASHRVLLRHLLDLLAHVRKYSEINLMGNDNLAIVFGAWRCHLVPRCFACPVEVDVEMCHKERTAIVQWTREKRLCSLDAHQDRF